MTIFVNPNEPGEYRLKQYPDAGVIYVRTPTKAMYRKLGKMMSKLRDAHTSPGETAAACVDGAQLVIEGWELEENGEPLPFVKDDKDNPTEETIMRLTVTMMAEVMGFAFERGDPTEEDAKN